MKKFFAFTLTLSILLCSFTVRAEDTTLNAENSLTESETSVNVQETETVEDNSTLTIDVIEELFWEELVNKSQSITSEEDKYVSWLINGINKTQTIPIYHDTCYVNYGMGGIALEKVDYDRLMQKFQRVIDLYNHYHDEDLQLEITPKILNELYMQVDVKSANLEYLENPVTCMGQLAHLELRSSIGVVYWESSQNFGSGKHGLATINNAYIPNDLVVTVNGVAYLDDYGNIISSSYGTTQEIEIWKKRMIHISANAIDLGWVYPTNLTRAE